MATCGQLHPDNSGVACQNLEGNHRLCTGYDSAAEDFVDWGNPAYEPPKNRGRKAAQQHLETVAARVAPDIRVATASASASAAVEELTGFAKGVQESARAAGRWDDTQKDLVMQAIIAVAKRENEFTSDAIWAELAGAVPVTKGLTAMLRLANRRGVLDSTGKTTISERGGEHDHGQRLTVWYSLIKS
jgi:hypothetical protein